jgi:hypothetical protein
LNGSGPAQDRAVRVWIRRRTNVCVGSRRARLIQCRARDCGRGGRDQQFASRALCRRSRLLFRGATFGRNEEPAQRRGRFNGSSPAQNRAIRIWVRRRSNVCAGSWPVRLIRWRAQDRGRRAGDHRCRGDAQKLCDRALNVRQIGGTQGALHKLKLNRRPIRAMVGSTAAGSQSPHVRTVTLMRSSFDSVLTSRSVK